jgi:hypothetical protein
MLNQFLRVIYLFQLIAAVFCRQLTNSSEEYAERILTVVNDTAQWLEKYIREQLVRFKEMHESKCSAICNALLMK